MPYSSVKDARDSVPSLKNLTTKQVKTFILVFNDLVKGGDKESEAIPKAIAAAKKVEKALNNTMDKNIQKQTLNDIIGEMHKAVDRQLREETGDYLCCYDPVWYSDHDDTYIYVYEDGDTFRYEYTMNGLEVEIDLPTRRRVVRETNYQEASDTPIERSLEGESKLVTRLLKALDKLIGDPSGKEEAPVIKQFDDVKHTTVEYLYIRPLPYEVDGVGDGYFEEDLQPMINSFNKAVEEDRMQYGLFHKHKSKGYRVTKAWAAEEDCVMGEHEIQKGQPLIEVEYLNDKLYELRKAGEITGPSIGARAKDIIMLENGVEKSLGESDIQIGKSALDEIKSQPKAKRILKGIHFDWDNPHIALTDPSQGGACSLKNDIVLEKSMAKLNESQKALLEEIDEEFTPIAKALGVDNTSVNKEEKDNSDMSEELQKQLADQKREIAILKAQKLTAKYNFDEEIEKELTSVMAEVDEPEAIVKALDAIQARQEEAVEKALEEAKEKAGEDNPLAKQLQEEKGKTGEVDQVVEETMLEKAAKAQDELLKKERGIK